MNAIPQSYPVVVEFSEGTPSPKGVLDELVRLGRSSVTESGDRRQRLHVVARNESAARDRAEKVTQGTVVEVGEPSPLQRYAKQKALPYRRSFIMTRFKRGRFQQQGGTGAHQPASAPSHPADVESPASGVGMGVSEAVDVLLGGESLDEASAAQRRRRKRRRKQFRAKNPQLARKLSRAAKRNARRGDVKSKRARTRKRTRRRKQRFRGRFDPNFESQGATMSESLEITLSGYEEASDLHRKLSKAPQEWLESNRGRKVVQDAIYGVRLREGNVPADALEAVYVDGLPGSIMEMEIPNAQEVENVAIEARDFMVGWMSSAPNTVRATMQSLVNEINRVLRTNNPHGFLSALTEVRAFFDGWKKEVPSTMGRTMGEFVSEIDKVLRPALRTAVRGLSRKEGLGFRPGHGTTESEGPGLYEVQVQFTDDRARDKAVANVMRFSEACCDACAREDSEDEAVFKVRARSDEAARQHVESTMHRLSLGRGSVVKVSGSGVPLTLTSDAEAETATHPDLLFEL